MRPMLHRRSHVNGLRLESCLGSGVLEAELQAEADYYKYLMQGASAPYS